MKKDLQIGLRFYKLVYRLYPAYLPKAFLAAFLQALVPFINVILPKLIIDELLGAQRASLLLQLVLFVALGNGILNVINRYMTYRMDEAYYDLMQRIELNMGNHIMNLDFEMLEDPAILNQKDQAIFPLRNQGVIRNMTMYTMQLIQYSLTLIGLMAIISRLNPLLIVFILGIVFLNSRIFKKQQAKQYEIFQEMVPLNRRYGYYLELTTDFSAAKDIRLFHMKPYIHDKLSDFHEKDCGLFVKMFDMFGKYEGMSQVILQMQMAVIYSYMVWQVFLKRIGIGDFSLYVSASVSFANHISLLLNSYVEYRQYCIYIGRYLDFEALPKKIAEGTAKPEVREAPLTLEFKNVWFKYPRSEDYTLKDVSLTLRSGEKLSVVGPNGAGKTTFIKLLCRLYAPEKGEILLNGRNIQEFSEEEYYKLLAVVFQDFKLFSFSIRENICMNQPCDPQDVEDALQKAGLSERIARLPKGIDTPLYKNFEEDGIELSGGEMQKLTIARAVYKDCPIVVLDEPTAALDPYAEYEIYSKFNDLVEDRTAIYISHRLSSCRFCDHIAVFNEGRLVEYGTWEELEKGNGLYAEMWQAQSQYYVSQSA